MAHRRPTRKSGRRRLVSHRPGSQETTHAGHAAGLPPGPGRRPYRHLHLAPGVRSPARPRPDRPRRRGTRPALRPLRTVPGRPRLRRPRLRPPWPRRHRRLHRRPRCGRRGRLAGDRQRPQGHRRPCGRRPPRRPAGAARPQHGRDAGPRLRPGVRRRPRRTDPHRRLPHPARPGHRRRRRRAGRRRSPSTAAARLSAFIPRNFSSFNDAFTHRTGYEWLSRDAAEVDAYAADEDCGFPFCAGLAARLGAAPSARSTTRPTSPASRGGCRSTSPSATRTPATSG